MKRQSRALGEYVNGTAIGDTGASEKDRGARSLKGTEWGGFHKQLVKLISFPAKF